MSWGYIPWQILITTAIVNKNVKVGEIIWFYIGYGGFWFFFEDKHWQRFLISDIVAWMPGGVYYVTSCEKLVFSWPNFNTNWPQVKLLMSQPFKLQWLKYMSF